MSTATVNVFIDDEGRVYPRFSDTPLPSEAIRELEYARNNLTEGDIIVDTYGRAYRVSPTHLEDYSFPILMAQAVDKPEYHIHTMDLEAPIVRIYHCGEPRHDIFR